MRKLSETEIEKFASSSKTQGNIIRTILSRIGPDSSTDIRELFFTAKVQGWDKETIQAILNGIAHAATPLREKAAIQPQRTPDPRPTPHR